MKDGDNRLDVGGKHWEGPAKLGTPSSGRQAHALADNRAPKMAKREIGRQKYGVQGTCEENKRDSRGGSVEIVPPQPPGAVLTYDGRREATAGGEGSTVSCRKCGGAG